jgi:hypothetical protein
VPQNALEKYDFFKFKSGNSSSLTFTQVKTVGDLEHNVPYLYKLKEEPGKMKTETVGEKVYDVFENTNGFKVETLAKYDPNDEVPGGVRALGTLVNNYIETEKHTSSAYYYFNINSQKFIKVTKKLNYRPYRAIFVVTPETANQAAQAPTRLNLELLDGTTTEIDASLVEDMVAPEYYDLYGRRVLNPVSGGIYIVNGKKVVLK